MRCALLVVAVLPLLSVAAGGSRAFGRDRDLGPFDPRLSVRGLLGVGLYSIGDVKDVYDSMQEAPGHGFASRESGPAEPRRNPSPRTS